MLDIVNSYKLKGIAFADFENILKAAQKIIPNATKGSLILHLVDNKTIRKLNKNHRKQDKVTDVLSFSYLDEEFGDDVLGEIYISIPRAKKQAQELGHNLKTELAFLFSHGILHIYAYHHANNKDLLRLENLQAKILKSACVKDVA